MKGFIGSWALVYYILSPFEFNVPPSEQDFSVCYACTSSDHLWARSVRNCWNELIDKSRGKFALKSTQQHYGSGREKTIKDLNYKATYFNTSSQKQMMKNNKHQCCSQKVLNFSSLKMYSVSKMSRVWKSNHSDSAAEASSDVMSFSIHSWCYSLNYSLLAHDGVDVWIDELAYNCGSKYMWSLHAALHCSIDMLYQQKTTYCI